MATEEERSKTIREKLAFRTRQLVALCQQYHRDMVFKELEEAANRSRYNCYIKIDTRSAWAHNENRVISFIDEQLEMVYNTDRNPVVSADLCHKMSVLVHSLCSSVPHDIGLKLGDLIRESQEE